MSYYSPQGNNFLRAVFRHWITLVGGCAVIVFLGVIERISGKNVPLYVYLVLLAALFCLACYMAWRDAQKKLAEFSDTGRRRRHFLAERLNALLREAGQVDFGMVSMSSMEGLGKAARASGYHKRVKEFLSEHYDSQTAERYDKERTRLLEKLLADSYQK
jgi:hypothetical protein